MRILKMLTISGGFLLIGMGVTVFGTTNGYLSGRYEMDIGRIGLLVTIMAAGRIIAVIGTLILSKKRLKGKILLIMGASLLTAGMYAIPIIPGYVTAIVCFFFMGLGHGLIDVSGSMLVAGLYPERFGSMTNIVQMFFGVGCLAGPLIAGTVLTFSDSWQSIYLIQGSFGILLLVVVSILRYPDPGISKNEQKKKKKNISFMSSGVFLLLAAIITLYSGAGHSLNAWVNKYMLDIVRFPAFFAAGTLAVYNMGLTAGRLLCGLFIDKVGSRQVLRIGAAGALFSISAALLSSDSIIIVTMLFATGIFFGGLFPTTITVAVCKYPDKVATVTSALILAAAAGSMTMPALIGYLSSLRGLAEGIRFIIIPVILLTAAAFTMKTEKRSMTCH